MGGGTIPPSRFYLAHKSFCEGRWKESLVLGDVFAVPAAPASLSTSLDLASWQFPSVDWFVSAPPFFGTIGSRCRDDRDPGPLRVRC